jgi:hypothetical protein
MTKDKPPNRRAGAGADCRDLAIEGAAETSARVIRRSNKSALGFDPYRGASLSQPVARKKDLRKLGEWIAAKRKAEESKPENERTPPTGGEKSKKS